MSINSPERECDDPVVIPFHQIDEEGGKKENHSNSFEGNTQKDFRQHCVPLDYPTSPHRTRRKPSHFGFHKKITANSCEIIEIQENRNEQIRKEKR